MPFLLIPALGNSKEHPRLGVPTFRGITLAEAPPSSVEFFQATGTLKGTLTAAQATAAIVAEIAKLTAEVEAARSRGERLIGEATIMTTNAGKLADMPVIGNEGKIILGFAVIVDTSLDSISLPSDTGAMDWFKSVQSQIHGLDIAGIGTAVTRFDREMDLHAAAVAKLRQIHSKLLEFVGKCEEGPGRDKVSKLKESLGWQRKLPGVLIELEAGRTEVASALGRIDAALSSLKEAA